MSARSYLLLILLVTMASITAQMVISNTPFWQWMTTICIQGVVWVCFTSSIKEDIRERASALILKAQQRIMQEREGKVHE